MHHLRTFIFTFILALLAASCGKKEAPAAAPETGITGMWVCLGDVYDPAQGTWDSIALPYALAKTDYQAVLKAYEADGNCYKFMRENHEGRENITPLSKESYTLDVVDGDTIYGEGERIIKMHTLSDSIMVIEYSDQHETWKRLGGFSESRRHELEALATEFLDNYSHMSHQRFFSVFVDSHQRQAFLVRIVGWLCAVVLVFVFVIVYYLRRKRQLERALAEVQAEIDERPQAIADATQAVRDELFQSPWYAELTRRLSAGEHLSDDDWTEVAHQVRRIYPHFRSSLYNVCRLSDTEYRVCLLLKLRIAPAAIAAALCKEKNTISSVRSRLFAKVFGRKGSSKEWDEFIESL